jgi:tRNA A-37 threonylcarbamoyl transferase component Bud32
MGKKYRKRVRIDEGTKVEARGKSGGSGGFHRINELRITQRFGGQKVVVAVPLPPMIRVRRKPWDDARIGYKHSRKAARILKDMPNVFVPVEHYDKEGTTRITNEVKGKTMQSTLDNLWLGKKAGFTIDEVEGAIDTLEEALTKLHNEGIPHGDLAKTNIILARTPKGDVGIGLLDWGYESRKTPSIDQVDIGSLRSTIRQIKDRAKKK